MLADAPNSPGVSHTKSPSWRAAHDDGAQLPRHVWYEHSAARTGRSLDRRTAGVVARLQESPACTLRAMSWTKRFQ
jgi:hypothetical protein